MPRPSFSLPGPCATFFARCIAPYVSPTVRARRRHAYGVCTSINGIGRRTHAVSADLGEAMGLRFSPTGAYASHPPSGI